MRKTTSKLSRTPKTEHFYESMATFMFMDPKLHADFILDRFLRNVHVDDNETLSKNEMESVIQFLS